MAGEGTAATTTEIVSTSGLGVLMAVALAAAGSVAMVLLAKSMTKPARNFLAVGKRRAMFDIVGGGLLPALVGMGLEATSWDLKLNNYTLWACCVGISLVTGCIALTRFADAQINDELALVRDELAEAWDVARQYLATVESVCSQVGVQRDDLNSLPANADATHVLVTLFKNQFFRLVVAVYDLYRKRINPANSPPARRADRVRVVYFTPQGQYLRAVAGWDGNSKSCHFRLEDRTVHVQRSFEMANPRPCLAVDAAVHGRRWLVPNTVKAHDDETHPFKFFEHSERDRLKSIMALPLIFDGALSPYDVLVIDTDRLGFFDKEQAALAGILHDLLAHKLHTEKAVAEHIQRLESTHVTSSTGR